MAQVHRGGQVDHGVVVVGSTQVRAVDSVDLAAAAVEVGKRLE
jgi:hypothetical protein